MHAEKKASLLEFSMKLDFTRSQFSWQLYDCNANIRDATMEFIHENTKFTSAAFTFTFFVCVFVGVLTHFLFHLFTNLFFVLSLFFPTNFCASVDSFYLCVMSKNWLQTEPDAPWLESPHLQAFQLLLRPLWRRFVRLTGPRPQMCMYILFPTIHHSYLRACLTCIFSFFLQPVIWMYTRNARNQCQTCVDATIPSEEEGPIWKFIARGINSFAQVLNYTNYCLLVVKSQD